jgi:hypothetical protein
MDPIHVVQGTERVTIFAQLTQDRNSDILHMHTAMSLLLLPVHFVI